MVEPGDQGGIEVGDAVAVVEQEGEAVQDVPPGVVGRLGSGMVRAQLPKQAIRVDGSEITQYGDGCAFGFLDGLGTIGHEARFSCTGAAESALQRL